MLLKSVKFVRKILDGIENFYNQHSSKLILLISIICVQLVFLSGYVQADDGRSVCIDPSFQESEEGLKAVYNTASGIHSVKKHGSEALQKTAAETIFGANSFCGVTEEDVAELNDFSKNGLIGVADAEVNAMINNPPAVNLPAHMADQWIPGSDVGNTATLYAADDGYNFLKTLGLQEMWEIFRDISYAGFVLILIAAGFMIMFRQKINGQVAINVMNTIPGVVLGLILVTFSFAICGFIIDIGRLLSVIIGNMMQSRLSALNPDFDVVSISGPVKMFRYAFKATMPEGSGLALGGAIGGSALLSVLMGNPVPAVIAGLGALLIVLGVGVAILYAVIKLYMTLVMTYFKLFLEVILGPIYLLIGSLPGKSSMMVEWLKRVFSNVLVFPLVFFLINLSRFIAFSEFGSPGMQGQAFTFMSGGSYSEPTLKFQGILVIAGYFLASGAPAIITEMLAVAESKGVAKAVEGAKRSASKIPLIGGLVGG